MIRSKLLLRGALAAMVAAPLVPAQALKINLINSGGVEQGTDAYQGFSIAAHYWESVFTNDATVNLVVGFGSLGPENQNVLGATGSNVQVVSIDGWENKLLQTRSQSTIDKLVAKNLPKTNINGAIKVITPGYTYNADGEINGIDAHSRVFDTDASFNNTRMYLTNANAKAVGYDVADTYDAAITFNSDFGFDFNPTNGISPNTVNFLVVSIHEIGHALGFTSGVDDYDYFALPDGPGGSEIFDPNDTYWGSALDMFRYSTNPDGFANGGPLLDWSIHDLASDGAALYTNPYFSVDGGQSALLGNLMSRGQFNTNSFQASHWRSAAIPGQPFLGIMDPIGFLNSYVTPLDLMAFDSIGWNTAFDPALRPDYAGTTERIYRAFAPVPEPSEWALLLIGFATVGMSARRGQGRGETRDNLPLPAFA